MSSASAVGSSASVPLSYVALQIRDTDALVIETATIKRAAFEEFEKFDVIRREGFDDSGPWDFEPGQ